MEPQPGFCYTYLVPVQLRSAISSQLGSLPRNTEVVAWIREQIETEERIDNLDSRGRPTLNYLNHTFLQVSEREPGQLHIEPGNTPASIVLSIVDSYVNYRVGQDTPLPQFVNPNHLAKFFNPRFASVNPVHVGLWLDDVEANIITKPRTPPLPIPISHPAYPGMCYLRFVPPKHWEQARADLGCWPEWHLLVAYIESQLAFEMASGVSPDEDHSYYQHLLNTSVDISAPEPHLIHIFPSGPIPSAQALLIQMENPYAMVGGLAKPTLLQMVLVMTPLVGLQASFLTFSFLLVIYLNWLILQRQPLFLHVPLLYAYFLPNCPCSYLLGPFEFLPNYVMGAAVVVACLHPTVLLSGTLPDIESYSSDSSETTIQSENPKSLQSDPNWCNECQKISRDMSRHDCARSQASEKELHSARIADLDLTSFLHSTCVNHGIPSNRVTIVVSALRSAKSQVALARALGVQLPEIVSGNRASTHKLSTIVEAKLHDDAKFKTRFYERLRQEIESLEPKSISHLYQHPDY